ncbi:hypothetical protein SKAU_G00353270, partial [Synaphobranchus kaupii]
LVLGWFNFCLILLLLFWKECECHVFCVAVETLTWLMESCCGIPEPVPAVEESRERQHYFRVWRIKRRQRTAELVGAEGARVTGNFVELLLGETYQPKPVGVP